MSEVNAYEAKTHLSELLTRVAKGERITITRHRLPVAILVHAGPGAKKSPAEVVEEIRAFRKGRTLGETSLRRLIEEGRR